MGLKTIHRGIRDLAIATWSSENSWGTAYDLYGARNATLTLQVETDQLEGDDVVLDRYTRIVSAQISIEQAAVDLEAVDMFVGGTLVSNASYEDLVITESDSVPYLGIAGKIVASSGVVEQHFLAAKCRMSGDLTLQAQVNNYMLPNAQFQAVNEGSTNGIIRFRKFTAATDVEIPLRTTTGSG